MKPVDPSKKADQREAVSGSKRRRSRITLTPSQAAVSSEICKALGEREEKVIHSVYVLWMKEQIEKARQLQKELEATSKK